MTPQEKAKQKAAVAREEAALDLRLAAIDSGGAGQDVLEAHR